MPAAVTLREAADQLGVSVSTLRRWVRAGAPVARRGRRGRGRADLVDPEAIRCWSESPLSGDSGHAALIEFASSVPEIVANAMEEAHRLAPDKRGATWMALAGWRLIVGALLEPLGVSKPSENPEAIERLEKIAQQMSDFTRL